MTTVVDKLTKLLIVDDEAVVCSLLQDALESEGYHVETASSGEEALDHLNQEPTDLLITDIRMPGMSGIELASKVRNLHPATGVVFMTGYASLNSAKDAIKHGALDYVMKPFELPEIRAAVSNAVSKLGESAELSSTQKLTGLSDLSHMLFEADDRKSLVRSSLKFAMMHERSSNGSVLYMDDEQDSFVMLTIEGNRHQKTTLGKEPLQSLFSQPKAISWQEPVLLGCDDDHPIHNMQPDDNLKPFLCPSWMTEQKLMVVVPVRRAETFHGIITLEADADTVRIKQSDVKFLSVMANQLAITLDNVSLLEETRAAYANLKALQDETIELEKMATRGEMSAEIGHELNNFIGVVSGNMELLDLHLQKQNYDKLGKYVSAITSTLEKIKTFTSNLMDLRPISSAKEIVPFDRILTEVIEYLRPQKRFRGVEIISPEQLSPTPFEADTLQIQQLFYNLFNNAADATVDSDVRKITVSLETEAEHNRFITSIRDTGSGFDPKSLAIAFREKFTTKETGHGFGLVVCKRIIENHGGKLDIDSTPGKGTCISISFPLATDTR
ncbi:MAG: hypothetical protein DRP45_01000 [Candidatus Zixiibacteriota bacterium]|nr:MAG: hypothetical protein DRP45_01000 [candidate division Zixibacteria bacterium]